MSKCRIVYHPNRSVAIIRPAPKSKAPDETEDAWLNRVFAKAMTGALSGLPYDDVDIATLPPTRENREAWEGRKGEGVTVNQTKAAALKADKERVRKIDAEIRRMAEQNLKDRGLL